MKNPLRAGGIFLGILLFMCTSFVPALLRFTGQVNNLRFMSVGGGKPISMALLTLIALAGGLVAGIFLHPKKAPSLRGVVFGVSYNLSLLWVTYLYISVRVNPAFYEYLIPLVLALILPVLILLAMRRHKKPEDKATAEKGKNEKQADEKPKTEEKSDIKR